MNATGSLDTPVKLFRGKVLPDPIWLEAGWAPKTIVFSTPFYQFVWKQTATRLLHELYCSSYPIAFLQVTFPKSGKVLQKR